jgi:hypothetical protein
MIRLSCPSCSKKLAVDDASAGTVFMCPACNNKFRVPATSTDSTPEPPPSSRGSAKRSSAGGVASPARDSARSSAARGARTAPAVAANGKSLDQLEVIDDDDAPRSRRGARRSGPEPTPQWVYITAGVAGVSLGGLVVGAFFSSVVTILLIVIGLPTSLLSRKWPLLGRVGIAYLLAGACIFMMSRTSLFQRPEGPPPRGASARAVDAHCAALLKDKGKVEAGAWVSVERPGDTALIKGLRNLITDAYKAGAQKLWLTNLQKLDPAGLPSPDLVVVLPDDEGARNRVVSWYVTAMVGKQVPMPGDKYLYVPWD